jgi:GNAT superfamily N-acetyltransferase
MVNEMSLDEHTLLWTLETSAFLVPELPGRVERLGVPGVRGRITADSDPFANLVGASTLDEGNADETIWQVREIYAGWNKEFGWLVSPLSTPFDLPGRLEDAGLVQSVEMAGMVCTDLGRRIAANPAVYVHEATADDVEAAIHTLADAMEIPVDRAYAMTEALFFSSEPIVRRVYLAFVEGVDYPVATAGMLYLPDQPIALLLSSATLPDFRGYGIYTSLMARRLADAQQDGIEAAIIQAVRETSAPICRKLGFVEIMPMELYVGYAEGEA